MGTAVRGAKDSDRRRVDMEARFVRDLADQAAKIGSFNVDIGKVRLPERIAESARGVRQKCEAGVGKLPRIFGI